MVRLASSPAGRRAVGSYSPLGTLEPEEILELCEDRSVGALEVSPQQQLVTHLVEPVELRDQFFNWIKDEHALSSRMINCVTHQDALLENMSAIRTSIERRNPYVDPLNFMQVALLRELRQLDQSDDNWRPVLDATLSTINGIAAGMKTTG